MSQLGLILSLLAILLVPGASPARNDLPAAAPILGGCQVFPGDNIWNTRVDGLPVDPHSTDYINSIGRNTGLHPDFGTVWDGAPNGIPYNIVPGSQPGVAVDFQYNGESDHGLYPIPANPLIEGGPNGDGDRHILILDQGHCKLYELFAASPNGDGTWHAGSGAIFDLNSHVLRPAGWTSADAAGLPILPGLVRKAEVDSGHIQHALRFTADDTRDTYIWPARHYASDLTSQTIPPMGQRFRLKATFDISGYPAPIQVILLAMKQYGIILADNGSDWYINGVPDSNWDDDMLVGELGSVKGSDFEAVNVSSLMLSPRTQVRCAPARTCRRACGCRCSATVSI